jgi:hypothetical protein
MRTPFSQTFVGAIFIAVVAGVIILLIQSNFFGSPNYVAPLGNYSTPTVPAPGQPAFDQAVRDAVGPVLSVGEVCGWNKTANECLKNPQCHWNISSPESSDEAYQMGWCGAR